MDVSLFLHSMAGLFAIMNPFVALPMFLALTDGAAIREQRRAALRVVLYTLVLTAVVFGSGTAVLRFFGIGITAFRIAGGIVLLVIGLSMLNGTGSSAHTGTKGEQEHLSQTPDVAFYPMAFPVIAGPGTITTLVILTGQAKGAAGYASIAAALLAVLAGLGVVLFLAGNIGHYLSQTLRSVMTRLRGMILAAIAVQMVIVGLKAAFPALAGS